MSKVHIYTTQDQPATRFVDRLGGRAIWTRFKPRRLIWCGECLRRHWAKYMVVQVYYDGVRFWCAPGHGCAGVK